MSATFNLESTIRRRQDELRGRRRNWRDELIDRWNSFSFYDLVCQVYWFLVMAYVIASLGFVGWLAVAWFAT